MCISEADIIHETFILYHVLFHDAHRHRLPYSTLMTSHLDHVPIQLFLISPLSFGRQALHETVPIQTNHYGERQFSSCAEGSAQLATSAGTRYCAGH